MAYKLVEGYQNSSAVPASTLDNHDFYILPIVNPDGKSSILQLID
jgi:murein tripeptide amidase MpaA